MPSHADWADEYLTERTYNAPQGLRLRKHRGDWLRHDGKVFRLLPYEELSADITGYFQGTPLRHELRRNTVNEIVHQLVPQCLVPDDIELPAYLDSGKWKTNSGLVVLENGVIDLGNFRATGIELFPHTPALVSRVRLPYSYDPLTGCPQWLAFLDEVLPDEESRRLLQEIFGYCLTSDTSQQKFFMFEGSGSNGKGVVTNILCRLLGSENVSALPLSRFGAPHDLVVLMGKLLNISSELKTVDKVAEDILKQLTGGDAVHFNPKHKSPFSAKPTARIILSTNERPMLTDRSNGIWRRLIVLPFPITIPEAKRDIYLENKLALELPGILNWAIQGARSLALRGRFQEPRASVEAREAFRKESNSAALFLDQCCDIVPGKSVSTRTLYSAYKKFCIECGHTPFNEGNFAKEVLKLPWVEKDRPRGGGPRRNMYLNIAITSPPGGSGLAHSGDANQAPLRGQV
jgi:putative DNA primase/helicase